MTAENGATHLILSPHKKLHPCGALGDLRARANCSPSIRRVIHMGYCYPNTALQYEIVDSLTPEIRQHLGVHCALVPAPLTSSPPQKKHDE